MELKLNLEIETVLVGLETEDVVAKWIKLILDRTLKNRTRHMMYMNNFEGRGKEEELFNM